MPQPSAVTRSASSLFSSTLASVMPSVFITLPRSGRIACLARSRPCLAEPPAESPSTTNSSLSSRLALVQSLSLPGRLRRPVVAVLRVTSACAARLASRARAARMMRADDRLGDGAVVIQPVLERRPHRRIDGRQHLGVVQPILGLPLELRLGDEQAEHAGQPLADVLGGQRHALRRQVVRVDVVAHRLAEAGAQAVLVRAAGAGRECR